MRVLHTSDLHLGSRLFSESPVFRRVFLESLREIAEVATAKSCDYLVVAGDLFDANTLNRLDTETILSTIDVFRELRRAGVRVVVSPGNHDYHLDENGVLEVFERAELLSKPRVRVGDAIETKPLELGDLAFIALPGLKNSAEVDYVGSRRVRVLGASSKPTVVLLHSIVDIGGARVGELVPRLSGLKSIAWGDVAQLFPQARYFALGHVHYPVPLERRGQVKAAYPGAPVGYDSNDLLDTFFLRNKGFRRRVLVVDLDKEPPVYEAVELSNTPDVEYVELPERVDLANAQSRLAEAVGRLKGRWRVVVVSVSKGTDSNILNRLRSTAEREGVFVYFRTRGVDDAAPFTLPSIVQVADLIESEKRLIAQLLPKYGLKLTPERVQELIDMVSRGAPLDELVEDVVEAVSGVGQEG